MDRLKLSRIDEDLESSEVAALCFLCRDIVNRKHQEGIKDAKQLFLRLEDKGLLDNHHFLCQLLRTIRRSDLLSLLETNNVAAEETDANPVLSEYRVMLYRLYEDMTLENLNKLKFLLSDKLGRRQTETCKTALDVFVEMEKNGFLSSTNLEELRGALLQLDLQLVAAVQRYMDGTTRLPQITCPPHVSTDYQRVNNSLRPAEESICDTQSSYAQASVCSDAEPKTKAKDKESSSLPHHADYYSLTHRPRGLCVVINNEKFVGLDLKNRGGTQQDATALHSVFSRLGFQVVVHDNLTAAQIRRELEELGGRSFLEEDALVVCVLSHGNLGCVYGIDEQKVFLRELTQPFTSRRAPTLAGKPKLFFIQACQGSSYQRGSLPCPPRPRDTEEDKQSRLEEDAGVVNAETVPWDADFLLGMATVPQCKSFRNTTKGSIYIQELCAQLMRSAESPEEDDILSVLTRVNREVSKGEYLSYKQMPEPKYTLTRKLVLKLVY